jgi:hypothetical protein
VAGGHHASGEGAFFGPAERFDKEEAGLAKLFEGFGGVAEGSQAAGEADEAGDCCGDEACLGVVPHAPYVEGGCGQWFEARDANAACVGGLDGAGVDACGAFGGAKVAWGRDEHGVAGAVGQYGSKIIDRWAGEFRGDAAGLAFDGAAGADEFDVDGGGDRPDERDLGGVEEHDDPWARSLACAGGQVVGSGGGHV